MHPHIGQSRQNGWNIGQFGPVELDVLARGKVAVALIPRISNVSQLPHLARVDRAIRNSHTQHIGVQLQV